MKNGLAILKKILASEKSKVAVECLDCWGDSHR